MPPKKATRKRAQTRSAGLGTLGNVPSPAPPSVDTRDEDTRRMVELAQRGQVDALATVFNAAKIAQTSTDEAFLAAAEAGQLDVRWQPALPQACAAAAAPRAIAVR
jgi:hypothetical protein